MGDKAILTEVLEASRLTETYSSLTASNLIDQYVASIRIHHSFLCRLKGTAGSHPVHYEGIDGANGGGDQVRIGQPDDASGHEVGGVPDVYSVDDAVEYLGFGRFQLLLALLTGLAWASLEFLK